MIFSKIFYYKNSLSGVNYTNESTSNLDIERLLSSHDDFWIKEEGSITLVPKHLIFSDWRVGDYNDEKIQAVKKIIRKFIEEGFTIDYLGMDQQLHSLTINTNYNDLPDILRQKPLNPESRLTEISKITKKPKDQMFLLDYYWIDIIQYKLDPEETPRTLCITDLLPNLHDLDAILESTAACQIEIDTLTNHPAPKIQTPSNCPYVTNYKKIHLTYKETAEFLNNKEQFLANDTKNISSIKFKPSEDVMTMLMMLEFLIDQVQQLCCKVYQKARNYVALYLGFFKKYEIASILLFGMTGIIY